VRLKIRIYGSSDQAATTEICTCQCCSKPETPYHPSQVSDSKKVIIHHSKERKGGQLKNLYEKDTTKLVRQTSLDFCLQIELFIQLVNSWVY
jgi:hypothetical protein